MLCFVWKTGNDDEFGFDVLPAGEELEHHLSRESRHLQVEQHDIELMVRVGQDGYCVVSIAEDGNVVLFAEYSEEEEADGWVVVND